MVSVLNVLEEEIFKRNPKFLTKEKSWRTWKGHQNVAVDEELVQKVAMGEKIRAELCDGYPN